MFLLQTVVIRKAGGPLGVSIVGGADHTSHPFGVDEPGVFVSKVIFYWLLFVRSLLFVFSQANSAWSSLRGLASRNDY